LNPQDSDRRYADGSQQRMVSIALRGVRLNQVEFGLCQQLLGLRRLNGRSDALGVAARRCIKYVGTIRLGLAGDRNPLSRSGVVIEGAADIVNNFLVDPIERDVTRE
jgi:hypothetical protein